MSPISPTILSTPRTITTFAITAQNCFPPLPTCLFADAHVPMTAHTHPITPRAITSTTPADTYRGGRSEFSHNRMRTPRTGVSAEIRVELIQYERPSE